MGIVLDEKHYFINVAKDIGIICQPLFASISLSMFVYGRYFNDGDFFLLSSNKEWIRHHLKQGYITPAPIPIDLLSKDEAYHIISGIEAFCNAKNDLIKMFNSDESIDLIYKGKDYYDVICFGFTPNYSPIEFFINNLDSFRNFVLYFRDKANSIFKNSEKNKLVLPKGMQGTCFINSEKNNHNDSFNKNLLKELKFNKFFITTPKGELTFTKQEMNSVSYLLKGYTVKEAAKAMKLSPRTIETYLKLVKYKLNCQNNADIIKSIASYDHLKDIIWLKSNL